MWVGGKLCLSQPPLHGDESGKNTLLWDTDYFSQHLLDRASSSYIQANPYPCNLSAISVLAPSCQEKKSPQQISFH